MCKLPVTFGGGIMIVYGGLPLSGSALNPPERSHRPYRRASTAEGWYVLSSIAEPSSSEQFGRDLSPRAEQGRPCAIIRTGVLKRDQRSPASPTTRAISSRTSRSTMPGRWSSSQACSNGRSISCTISSSVRLAPPSGSSGSLRRSRGSAPSWANAAAAAPEVAAETMRSRSGSSLASSAASECDGRGSIRPAASAGEAAARSGEGDDAVAASAHGDIRRTEPSSSTTWVSSRMSLLSPRAGARASPGALVPRRRSAGSLSSAMMRLMEAMISSIEGSGVGFSTGMEAPDEFRLTWIIAPGVCRRDRLIRAGSLRKATAEADPLILHFLVVPLHVVELHRQFELGRDQPAGRRSHVELGQCRIMFGGDELGLRREQCLVLDQNVKHGTGAHQRLLLGALEGDLRSADGRSEGRDACPRRLQGRPTRCSQLHRCTSGVIDLAAALPDRLLCLPGLRVDRAAFIERYRHLCGNRGRLL